MKPEQTWESEQLRKDRGVPEQVASQGNDAKSIAIVRIRTLASSRKRKDQRKYIVLPKASTSQDSRDL